MEGFDTLTMSYMAAPMALGNLAAGDPLGGSMLPVEMGDRHSNFDAETYAE